MESDDYKYRVSEIENFNLDNFTQEKFNEYNNKYIKLFDNINLFPKISIKSKGKNFIRCRENKFKTINNLGINDLWYPQDHKYMKFGRLNNRTHPMLYASDSPRTAIYEKQPEHGDWISILSFCVNTESIECTVFQEYLLENMTFVNKEREKLLYEFLIRQFKKIVPKGKEILYLPTMLLAQALNPIDTNCIIYDSVATAFNGINFAFNPKFIDNNWTFGNARIIEIIEKNAQTEDYLIKCLWEANSIKDGKLNWRESGPCDGHIISKLVNHKIL